MVSHVSCAATRCPTGLQCIEHQKRKTRTLHRKTKRGIRSERAASVKYISACQPEMIRGEKGYIFWESIINSWVVWRSKGEKLPVNMEHDTREALQMGTQVSHLALASMNDHSQRQDTGLSVCGLAWYSASEVCCLNQGIGKGRGNVLSFFFFF